MDFWMEMHARQGESLVRIHVFTGYDQLSTVLSFHMLSKFASILKTDYLHMQPVILPLGSWNLKYIFKKLHIITLKIYIKLFNNSEIPSIFS